ncbi:MAG TPA: 2-dehydropantoate 2-reductase [Ktedonobacteraceae bacterium]|nr:2-dehydropantoate 2-reductase [Ktedonobacteraceae bacterium]
MDTSNLDIIGIGGAGGLIASSLMRGTLTPRIFARGSALKQLRDVGLTIITDQHRAIFAPISCSALDEVATLASIVCIATKSYDIPVLLETIATKLSEDTLFIVVQNGFAAYDMVSAAVGAERVAMGVLYVGAQIISPAVIDIKPGIAQLFLPARHRKCLGRVVDALESGGMEAALVDDIERRMWMKQLFLVPFAIVNTEMRQPIGKVYQNAAARERWGDIAREMAAVATACGIPMPTDPAAASLAVAERFDPQADSSFARDIWANRPHEAEALFGPPLQRAAAHGVPCPLLQEAYERFGKRQGLSAC